MGYDLTVHAKNQKLANRMFDFLKEHGKTYSEIPGSEYERDDKIGYHIEKEKKKILYKYQSGLSGWDRVYTYALVHWIAVKISQRKSKFKTDGKNLSFDSPVPYYIYDGGEKTPVISHPSNHPGKDTKFYVVDKSFILVDQSYLGSVSLTVSGGEEFSKRIRDFWKKVEELQIFHNRTKFKKLVNESFSDEIKKGKKLISKEIKRLDTLWDEELWVGLATTSRSSGPDKL